jgi:magnesium transporter
VIFYNLNKGTLNETNNNDENIRLLSINEFENSKEFLDLNLFNNVEFTKMDVLDNHYILSFVIPSFDDEVNEENRFQIIFNKLSIVFIDDTKIVEKYLVRLKNRKNIKTISELLFYFITALTFDDFGYLEGLEKRLLAVEQDAFTEKISKNGRKEILLIRRKLIELEDYYEQLEDISLNLIDDENEYFTKKEQTILNNMKTRISRLLNHANSLKEFGNQVRETYQTQVDIKLNQIMKILTIVTIVFLPFTLVAGWFGMNFQFMPELKWEYSYLVVTILTLFSSIVLLLLFVKKKWL